MNKNNKFIFILLFVHTSFLLCIFYFFIFLFFLFTFLGWAQLSPHVLGWTQPARPGSLAQASDPAKKTNARVKQFHACINNAKVIKLP